MIMNPAKAGLRLSCRSQICPHIRLRPYTTASHSTAPPHITHADVAAARKYCSNLLLNFDSPAYTLQTFLPPSSLDAYLAIRAFNIELARVADLISNPTVGALRMQFWRDNVTRTFDGAPPAEPVAILLYHSLLRLQDRQPNPPFQTLKSWLLKIVHAREQYMDHRPYVNLDALEWYAENTYSTLLYLTLAHVPSHSMTADHLASHIGKATGIVAVLRGLPLLAFPPPPNMHSNNSEFNRQMGGSASGWGRQGAVMLPLDIMAESGVQEEEVYRLGAEAPRLKDAVFKVATRANDHLITAREMLRNLEAGREVGHAFEHEGEEGHVYHDGDGQQDASRARRPATPLQEVHRGFGALMPAVATKLWLERLEKCDFDVFKPELRRREWKLPWRAYWAFKRKKL